MKATSARGSLAPGREIERGEECARRGELEAAAECFERAAGPPSLESASRWGRLAGARARAAWLEVGAAHVRARRLIEAARAFDRALARAPSDPEARLGRARVRHRAGRFEEALDDLHPVIDSVPCDPGPYLLFATCAAGAGDHAYARAAIVQAVRVASAVVAARGIEAGAMAGAPEASEETRSHAEPVPRAHASRPARERAPHGASGAHLHADAWFRRAARLAGRGRLAEADAAVASALRLNPDYREAMRLRAGLGLARGRPRLALERLEEPCRRWPADADLHMDAAAARYALGELGAAERALDRALALNRDLGRAHRLLALIHASQGRIDEALRSASRGFVRERDVAARTLSPPAHPAGCEEPLARAIARWPDYADLHLARAIEARAEGDRAAARRAVTEALRLNPDYDAAALESARLDLEEGHAACAASRLEALALRRPGWADAHLLIARAHRATGERWAAVASLGRALRANPGYAEARAELASLIEERRRSLTRAVVASRVPSANLTGAWAIRWGFSGL